MVISADHCPENHIIHLGCTVELMQAAGSLNLNFVKKLVKVVRNPHNTPRMHSRALQSKQTTYTPILRVFSK